MPTSSGQPAITRLQRQAKRDQRDRHADQAVERQRRAGTARVLRQDIAFQQHQRQQSDAS